MAAFNFPESPPNGFIVKNEATGVSYKFDSGSQTWVVVSTDVTSLYATEIQLTAEIAARQSGDTELETYNTTQDSRLNALEEVNHSEQITYQIRTDKILGNADPAIELVDSAGSYSNVKFQGTGGIDITSDQQAIIINASNLDVNLDNYYTKPEIDDTEERLQIQIDELLITKGTASVYTLNDIGIQVGIRPGDFYIDNTVVKSVQFISLAPSDDNSNNRPIGEVGDILEIASAQNHIYRYSINQINDGMGGVSFLSAADPDDLLMPGQTYKIFIYPQNQTYASITYVDQQDNAVKEYVDDAISGLNSVLGVEGEEPEIYYGDNPPTGTRRNGDLWFDAMHLRLNVWSQGAWINPDRNDGAALENRLTLLEARIAQLEGN